MTQAVALIQKNRFVPSILAGAAVFFILLYIVSIFGTVRHTAERARAENSLSKLSSTVSDLEFQYISLKNDLTKDSLADVGLEPVATLSYVSRSSAVAFNTVK